MVGVTFCVVEFSYFKLCKGLCKEALQSTGRISQGEDTLGARDKILNPKVVHRACAGRAPGEDYSLFFSFSIFSISLGFRPQKERWGGGGGGI